MMTLCCVMLAIFLDLVPIPLEANISIENIHEVTNSPSIPQPKGRKAANACQVDWIFCTSRSLGWQHRCFPKTRNRGTQKSFKAPYEKKISYWWLKNMFIWLLDDNPLHNTNNVDQWYPSISHGLWTSHDFSKASHGYPATDPALPGSPRRTPHSQGPRSPLNHPGGSLRTNGRMQRSHLRWRCQRPSKQSSSIQWDPWDVQKNWMFLLVKNHQDYHIDILIIY